MLLTLMLAFNNSKCLSYHTWHKGCENQCPLDNFNVIILAYVLLLYFMRLLWMTGQYFQVIFGKQGLLAVTYLGLHKSQLYESQSLKYCFADQGSVWFSDHHAVCLRLSDWRHWGHGVF